MDINKAILVLESYLNKACCMLRINKVYNEGNLMEKANTQYINYRKSLPGESDEDSTRAPARCQSARNVITKDVFINEHNIKWEPLKKIPKQQNVMGKKDWKGNMFCKPIHSR